MTEGGFNPSESELCVFGARDVAGLAEELGRWRRFLEYATDVSLEDVAYTAALSLAEKPERLCIVARTVNELRDRLALAEQKVAAGASRIRDKNGIYYFSQRLAPTGKVAFFFPGITSFSPDLLRELCLRFDVCVSAFDELEEALDAEAVRRPLPPGDYLFPPSSALQFDYFAPAYFAETFTAVLAANVALERLLLSLGVKPDGLIGFGGGDLAAMDVAGVYGKLDRAGRVQFLREGYQMLNRVMTREDLATCMAFSLIDPPEGYLDRLREEFAGQLVLTVYASPRSQTIAAGAEIAPSVAARLAADGVKALRVPGVAPFNTPWCAKAMPTVEQFLSPWLRNLPSMPLYSCSTAQAMPSDLRAVRRQVVDQWTQPIHFDRTVRQLYADGYRIFVEMGARGNMANLIGDILEAQPHQTVAVSRVHRSALTQFHHALALLIAQGVPVDVMRLHAHRRCQVLAVDKPLTDRRQQMVDLSLAPLREMEWKDFSSPVVLAAHASSVSSEGTRNARTQRVEFGTDFPLLRCADVIRERPEELVELRQTLRLSDYPFLRDYATGSEGLSFVHPEMRGLTVLSMASSLEIMAEAARMLQPKRRVVRVENLRTPRWLGFVDESLTLCIKAEVLPRADASTLAVRVQIREDGENAAFTWPAAEAVLILGTGVPAKVDFQQQSLTRPRSVNWSHHDIYPERLFLGGRLQIIEQVELWSEEGIDFDVVAPAREGAVAGVRMPLFTVWPQFLDGIISSFSLWRSHERFAGAVSLPFRCRRIVFHALSLPEKTRLRCSFRLRSVTSKSHTADILVSDGAGGLLLEIRGCEELCERVPVEYRAFILRPTENFITRAFAAGQIISEKGVLSASRFAAEIPEKIFESHQELWLKTLASVVLAPSERAEWFEMSGTVSRRAEWLFGRIAAKETVREFLQRHCHANWADADIPIWPDDSGKPHPLGPWREHANVKLDLSIAHTGTLIMAAVVANASVGIDVERADRALTEEFIRGVFSPEEVELAARASGSSLSVMLRFWCAKEAISKALGTGIRYSPKDLVVVSFEAASGDLEIELRGQWLQAFKSLTGRRNRIQTGIFRDHAFASCVLPPM